MLSLSVGATQARRRTERIRGPRLFTRVVSDPSFQAFLRVFARGRSEVDRAAARNVHDLRVHARADLVRSTGDDDVTIHRALVLTVDDDDDERRRNVDD